MLLLLFCCSLSFFSSPESDPLRAAIAFANHTGGAITTACGLCPPMPWQASRCPAGARAWATWVPHGSRPWLSKARQLIGFVTGQVGRGRMGFDESMRASRCRRSHVRKREFILLCMYAVPTNWMMHWGYWTKHLFVSRGNDGSFQHWSCPSMH